MTTEPANPARAVRFVFAYDADGVRLVSRQEVAALAPPTDPIEPERAPAALGFFAELRDAGDAAVYRRVIPPIPRDVEVFDETPDRTVSRVPVERPSGVFAVLVPDEPAAEHLALVDTSPPTAGLAAEGAEGAEAAEGVARELIRVPLRGGVA